MEIDQSFLTRLRKLIGRECGYAGKACVVIDVLSDENALILEAKDALPPIQTDQYGQATFRSKELFQLPIFDGDEAYSEEVMDLFASLNDRGGKDKPASL